ncbi:hypothetical protein CEXT_303091 [Caerostris extrusa]|nr:hypothetical protein CEXT_303091 [Caerostris extrusa]
MRRKANRAISILIDIPSLFRRRHFFPHFLGPSSPPTRRGLNDRRLLLLSTAFNDPPAPIKRISGVGGGRSGTDPLRHCTL